MRRTHTLGISLTVLGSVLLIVGCESVNKVLGDLNHGLDQFVASFKSIETRDASGDELVRAEATAAARKSEWTDARGVAQSPSRIDAIAVPLGDAHASDDAVTMDVLLVDAHTGRSDGTIRTVELDPGAELTDGATVDIDGFKTVYAKANE